MSLQKQFKARYPKANFADFKTGDFFGKPNIFFHSEAEMKGQLCLTTTEKISDLVFTSPKR